MSELTPDTMRNYARLSRPLTTDVIFEYAEAWQADKERIAELESDHPPTNAGYWRRQHTRLIEENETLAAEVRRLSGAERAPKIHEVVAARVISNWDGEGDTLISLIYMDNDGRWIHDESGAPVLEYVGDKIIEWWPLEAGTGNALPTPTSEEPK